MAQIQKPSGLNKIWANTGDKVAPDDAKITQGWVVQKPPYQYVNFLDNKQDSAIAHINQHGIAVWDAETEYQANKSYVQNPTDGVLYRCILTHTNQPVTNATYWTKAFTPASEAYTKSESDGRYLQKANNLSDVSNTSTARSNLGLGTASLANLTTDRLSFATGNAMRVGDYGIGSTAASITDPDTMYRPNGVYDVSGSVSWAQRPVTGWTRLLHMAHENAAGYASQFAFANFEVYNTNRVLFRTGSSGAWADWKEFWHTGNFDPASKPNADQISSVGLWGGDIARPYIVRTIDNVVCYLQPLLGYAPIQQGGGTYQYGNKLNIGWDGDSLRYQVDSTDMGRLLDQGNFLEWMATTTVGAIGSYALLRLGGGGLGAAVPAGTLVAGSSCAYAAADGTASGTPGGTWRVMGHAYDADANSANSTTLCLRVS